MCVAQGARWSSFVGPTSRHRNSHRNNRARGVYLPFTSLSPYEFLRFTNTFDPYGDGDDSLWWLLLVLMLSPCSDRLCAGSNVPIC